ncbi:MAG: DUF4339 domain-containing protein [Candidatus Brocadiia bacterium]
MGEPDAVWFIADESGRPAGPFRADLIRQWVRDGDLPASTPCWREGMSGWRPAEQTDLLRDAPADLPEERKILWSCLAVGIPCGVVAVAVGLAAILMVARWSMGRPAGRPEATAAEKTKAGAPRATQDAPATAPAPASPSERAERAVTLSNLSNIARAVHMHAMQHNELGPPGLATVAAGDYLPSKDVLVSPRDPSPARLPDGTRCSFDSCFDRHSDRIIRLGALENPAETMMVWERRRFAAGERAVAFFDGHVETVDETRFRELLRRLDAAMAEMPRRRE